MRRPHVRTVRTGGRTKAAMRFRRFTRFRKDQDSKGRSTTIASASKGTSVSAVLGSIVLFLGGPRTRRGGEAESEARALPRARQGQSLLAVPAR